MSPINAHRPRAARGFTLTELMVALSLAIIVIAGILAAYLFLGRNLTRLVNMQQQEAKSRRALQYFTRDMSSAIQLTTSTDSQIVLTMPTSGSNTSVTYTYTAGADGTGTFTRTDTSGTTTMLTDLTAFDFDYYNESGSAIASSTPQSVKAVEFTFTSAVGTTLNGTRVTYASVSPRIVLRNKPLLE